MARNIKPKCYEQIPTPPHVVSQRREAQLFLRHIQTLGRHDKLIIDMAFDSDITYLFTASCDGEAKSWMPEIGDELKTFDGGRKAVICVVPKGELCKLSSATLLGKNCILCDPFTRSRGFVSLACP